MRSQNRALRNCKNVWLLPFASLAIFHQKRTLTGLRRTAQFVRHLPGLDRVDWLWDLVRIPYHYMLDLRGRGTKVIVGGAAEVWIPAEFTGSAWEMFEPESVSKFAEWVRHHSGGFVLDIGSSLGIYSAIALFCDNEVEVVAFDSDLASLAAVRRLCQHAAGGRLRLVHGFITQIANDITSFSMAIAATEAALLQTDIRSSTRYLCLGDPEASAIPRRRLDDLISDNIVNGRPTLIKCDVEGAELLVLSGGETLLRRLHPTLLLSVHPPVLPSYGHSKDKLETFLRNFGYQIRCLAVDHEEHWWCEFKE